MVHILPFSEVSYVIHTGVFDAPSISITSTEEPSVIEMHEAQAPHGTEVGPSLQFKAFASILAVEVFPTPLGQRKGRRAQPSLDLRNFSGFG